MSTACVILAAGASTRLGQAKQLVRMRGETLLDRTVRIACEAGCSPVVVVLGAGAEAILGACRLEGAEIVTNAAWADGMSTSIRLGLGTVAGRVAATVMMTCDQPAVNVKHLELLMKICREAVPPAVGIVASRYAGGNGVPACFPATMFSQLFALAGDQGARTLLQDAVGIQLPGGELDIDTPAALARMRQLYGEEEAV